MKHHNDNLLCSLDIETTGLIPGFHEILQIAVIPLGDDYDWNRHMKPFDLDMRPNFVERVDSDAIKTLRRLDTSLDYEKVVISKAEIARFVNNGVGQEKGSDMFLDWYERLGLKPKKRIIPVGHNLHFDMKFICEWLGQESFDYVFDPRWRDTMVVSLFWNDVDGFKQDRCLFKDAKLSSLCTSLKVENALAHNAFNDALSTARCYGRMVKQFDLTAKLYEGEVAPPGTLESAREEKANDRWLKNLPQDLKDLVIQEYLSKNPQTTYEPLLWEHRPKYGG